MTSAQITSSCPLLTELHQRRKTPAIFGSFVVAVPISVCFAAAGLATSTPHHPPSNLMLCVCGLAAATIPFLELSSQTQLLMRIITVYIAIPPSKVSHTAKIAFDVTIEIRPFISG